MNRRYQAFVHDVEERWRLRSAPEFLELAGDPEINSFNPRRPLSCPCCWAGLDELFCAECQWHVNRVLRCPRHEPELRMVRAVDDGEAPIRPQPEVVPAIDLIHIEVHHRPDGPQISALKLLTAIDDVRRARQENAEALARWDAIRPCPASWLGWRLSIQERMGVETMWIFDAELALLGLGKTTKTLLDQLSRFPEREALITLLSGRLSAWGHHAYDPHEAANPGALAHYLREARQRCLSLRHREVPSWVRLVCENEAHVALVHDEWAPEYEHLHGVLPQQRESDWCERWEAVLERHVAFENYTRSREKPPVFEERIEQYVTLWRNGQELPTLKRRSNGEHS